MYIYIYVYIMLRNSQFATENSVAQQNAVAQQPIRNRIPELGAHQSCSVYMCVSRSYLLRDSFAFAT